MLVWDSYLSFCILTEYQNSAERGFRSAVCELLSVTFNFWYKGEARRRCGATRRRFADALRKRVRCYFCFFVWSLTSERCYLTAPYWPRRGRTGLAYIDPSSLQIKKTTNNCVIMGTLMQTSDPLTSWPSLPKAPRPWVSAEINTFVIVPINYRSYYKRIYFI